MATIGNDYLNKGDILIFENFKRRKRTSKPKWSSVYFNLPIPKDTPMNPEETITITER